MEESLFCPSCANHPMLCLNSIDATKESQDGFMPIFDTQLPSSKVHSGKLYVKIPAGDTTSAAEGGSGDVQLLLRSIDQEKALTFTAFAADEAASCAVWFQNCVFSDVADPSLIKAAEALPGGVVQLSTIIARIMLEIKLDGQPFCRHGILLNHRICTTLVTSKVLSSDVTSPAVGLYNIVDILAREQPLQTSRLDAIKPVRPELFEVAGEEEAMSVKTFLAMKDWETRETCQQVSSSSSLVTRRKWGHLLFLSHAWSKRGVPGNRYDLEELKEAVRTYIATALDNVRQEKRNITVKNIAAEDDFGIWLDYPIVPNNEEHVKSCQRCSTKRKEIIAKMGALPTISTTIALHPNQVRRGWILHELSSNSHKNTIDKNQEQLENKLEFGHRINLMTDRRVFFTNGSDGWALRCNEFIRLGQMPRCWPSVTRVLLQDWEEAGVKDESDTDALGILLKYARTFEYECQGLKRAMVEIPQTLARFGLPIDSGTETGGERLTPSFEGSASSIPTKTDIPDPFDFNMIQKEIMTQYDDMVALDLELELCDAAATLQRLQFVAVTMGLRAELLHGGGVLHWVALASITQMLTTVKRTVRLFNGEHVVNKASCNVTLIPLEESSAHELEVPASTTDLMKNGVPETALQFALEQLFTEGSPDDLLGDDWTHRSGKTSAWDDASLE